jgi:hypothetical protein
MVVTLVTARNVSALPCRFVRSIPEEWIYSLKVSQFALCQLRRTVGGGAAEGRANVTVIELWSEVVSWFTASGRIELVIFPRDRQRSIVDGVLPFLG